MSTKKSKIGRELGKSSYEDEFLQLHRLDEVKDFESFSSFAIAYGLNANNFDGIVNFINEVRSELDTESSSYDSFEVCVVDALAHGILYENVKGQNYSDRRSDVKKKFGGGRKHPCKNLDLQVATELVSLYMLGEDTRKKNNSTYLKKSNNYIFETICSVLHLIGVNKETRSISKAWNQAESFYKDRKSPYQTF